MNYGILGLNLDSPLKINGYICMRMCILIYHHTYMLMNTLHVFIFKADNNLEM